MLTLAVMGDVMLGGLVGEGLPDRTPESVWGDLLPDLRQADLTLANLECVIATSGTPQTKTFTFRAPPEAADVLRAANMDAVSLANNHSLDCGPEALGECLERLDDAGILHAGAGRDHDEAWRPVYLEKDDLRIGLIALSDNEPGWAAGPWRPGIAYAPVDPAHGGFADLVAHVRHAKAECDLLVASAHWGPHMRRVPPPRFQEFARRLCGAGVDLFWGHSAHLFQGMERQGRSLILYDTGDFVDDYRVDPEERNDLGFLFLVAVDHGGIQQVRLVPTKIDAVPGRVRRAAQEDAAWSCRRMESLCGPLGTRLRYDNGDLVLGPVRPRPEVATPVGP